ncbi:metal ABC transporter substrate-binding protein [Clostridium faecium]|uniref:metal ABC transporter solute-binding protein, Zn/Mn family n=1 Tax=uncultured Clostridium sp. TaxID=59620 RepID=UPI0024B8ECEC|nr:MULTISPECIES: zinc ABC transporter substrate-binding protein [Clostridium]MDU1350052.1 zinc ABC transporter substrate-binding protein [Clostridium argentinense]
MKKIINYMLILMFSIALIGCSKQDNNIDAEKNNKIKVVASFYAMEEFAKEIGKDKIEVYTVVPDGVEPHDFEPKAKDLANLEEANLLVLNGLDMEHWKEDVLKVINNSKLKVVDTSEGGDFIKLDEEHKEETEKEHGAYDPHLWLGLNMAKLQADNIKKALIEIDGDNKDYYEKNYNEFAKEIDDLYNDYKGKFQQISNKNFITGHATFGYLCRDFGLNQYSIEGVFAEGEPSPKQLKELTDLCKDKNINTVFVESLVSPQISETLAREVNGKTEKIYTLHSKEDGLNYIEAMKYNLETIYNSMK